MPRPRSAAIGSTTARALAEEAGQQADEATNSKNRKALRAIEKVLRRLGKRAILLCPLDLSSPQVQCDLFDVCGDQST